MSLYKNFLKNGFNFFVGVPCSALSNFIAEMEKDEIHPYIPATKEDVAMAIAAGALMTGKKPLVFLQSSGLGHLVNIITSLLKPYGFSVHLLISIRHTPFEHEFMGKKCRDLLRILDYENHVTLLEELINEN